MHTRASNFKLVEPLSELERTLNRRHRRRNRRVPFERTDERPAQPKIVYLPILDIKYFRYFVDIIENYNPLDDEPMWATDRVVAPTPDSAITIPETANEFSIKGNHLALVKKTNLMCNSDTDKIMTRMDVMTMKMDAQYKEMQSRSNHSILEYAEGDKPMSPEAEAKFMQTFRRTRLYNDHHNRDSNHDNWRSRGRNDYNRDNYRLNSDDKPDLQRKLSEFIKAQQWTNSFVKDAFIDLKTKLKTTTKNHQASIQNLEAKFNRFADKQCGRPSGSLPSNT
ncbi:hypothetical protein Tco_0103789 [Tanacetum coccineum]